MHPRQPDELFTSDQVSRNKNIPRRWAIAAGCMSLPFAVIYGAVEFSSAKIRHWDGTLIMHKGRLFEPAPARRLDFYVPALAVILFCSSLGFAAGKGRVAHLERRMRKP